MTDQLELKLCGVVVGTCSGWDEQDLCVITFYDPLLSARFAVAGMEAATCLDIDFNEGTAEFLDGDGEVLHTLNLFDWLAPRRFWSGE